MGRMWRPGKAPNRSIRAIKADTGRKNIPGRKHGQHLKEGGVAGLM